MFFLASCRLASPGPTCHAIPHAINHITHYRPAMRAVVGLLMLYALTCVSSVLSMSVGGAPCVWPVPSPIRGFCVPSAQCRGRNGYVSIGSENEDPNTGVSICGGAPGVTCCAREDGGAPSLDALSSPAAAAAPTPAPVAAPSAPAVSASAGGIPPLSNSPTTRACQQQALTRRDVQRAAYTKKRGNGDSAAQATVFARIDKITSDAFVKCAKGGYFSSTSPFPKPAAFPTPLVQSYCQRVNDACQRGCGATLLQNPLREDCIDASCKQANSNCMASAQSDAAVAQQAANRQADADMRAAAAKKKAEQDAANAAARAAYDAKRQAEQAAAAKAKADRDARAEVLGRSLEQSYYKPKEDAARAAAAAALAASNKAYTNQIANDRAMGVPWYVRTAGNAVPNLSSGTVAVGTRYGATLVEVDAQHGANIQSAAKRINKLKQRLLKQ